MQDGSTYVGTLGRILVAGLRSKANVFQTRLVILTLTMLTEEDHHSQALPSMSVGAGDTLAYMGGGHT